MSLETADPYFKILHVYICSSEVGNSASSVDVIGQVVAWASTCLYLVAKLPQIHRNYVRKSTEGLAANVCHACPLAPNRLERKISLSLVHADIAFHVYLVCIVSAVFAFAQLPYKKSPSANRSICQLV